MSVKYVEYLESDGNSYFDTIKSFPSGTYKIEMKYNDDTIISTHNDRLIGLTNNSFYYQINQYGVRQVKDTNRDNEQYVDKIVNNVLTDTFEMPSNTSNLRIFHTETVAQIYYIKLYDTSNNLLYHFRGALDNNNTPCLHEVVNDVIYYNNGTGTFSYGRFIDALYLFADNNEGAAENLGSYRLYNMKIDGDSEGVESGVDYVDYIESDGSQYLLTGIEFNSTRSFEIEFIDNGSGSSAIFCYGLGKQYGHAKYCNPQDMNNSAKLYSYTPGTLMKLKITYDTFINNEEIQAHSNLSNGEINILGNANSTSRGSITLYSFKIYENDGSLLFNGKPCLDTEGIPCMYDEVSGEYFYNQGTGTFGYKKELRDFQPVLDSNGVPCLMDKINKKYYYDKNGKGFGCDGYSGVSYIKGDYNSYIDTGLIANEMHGYRIEMKYINATDKTNTNLGYQQMLFGSSEGGLDNAVVNCHMRYDWTLKAQGLTPLASVNYNESEVVIETTFTVNTPTSSYSIFLFGTNGINTSSDNHNACDATIYYWKVYDTNNNLIQHLIPAIDTEGSIGMYDLVTETFFYNQGTGEFSYGIEEDECPKANYVEYLKAPDVGNQINTGITYDNTYSKIEFKFNTNNCNASDEILRAGGDTKFWFWIYYGNIRFLNCSYTFENGTSVDIDVTITSTECIINGITYTYETPLNSISQNMLLFSYSNWIKLYYFRVYDSEGNLIQDLHPSLDNDKIPCMYDTVSDSYFYSNGNDTFEHGKSIGYTPIKYIETNGTQYIDTGVVPTDNTDIDMVARAVAKLHYIEDGLILCLDAIDNTRDGHNASSTVWEDLSGNGLDFNLTDVTVNDTTMTFNGTSSVGTLQDIELWRNIVNNTEQYTVEICFKFVGFGDSYQPIISTNLGNVNVAKFIKNIQVGQQKVSLKTIENEFINNLNTISCDGNDIIYHVNTKLRETEQVGDYVTAPSTDVFWIGARLTGSYYRFTGEICSIRIYNKKLTDEERLYNHSSDVVRYGVPTDVSVINTDRNYLMNDFYTDTTYKYKETDTTVEPNLTASAGATLTLGSTYMAYLTESEIEQAVDNGWTIQ